MTTSIDPRATAAAEKYADEEVQLPDGSIGRCPECAKGGFLAGGTWTRSAAGPATREQGSCEICKSNNGTQKMQDGNSDWINVCPKCVASVQSLREQWSEENFGVWSLPADSSQSLKLAYTVEELTEVMRNNKDKIREAMEKIEMPSPLHIPRKS